MRIFRFFEPAPFQKEIEDANVVQSDYKYWRLRIFLGMYIGYVLFYFTRKSFTFAMPSLVANLGLDKGQLGILASILSLTYGVSKFVSGGFADRSNPRYFMAIGLMLTGVCNIFFGLSSSVVFFAIFWGLNGWFQGWGWPPCARLLTHWYSQKERGAWWGVWNTSHSVGGFLIPFIAIYCANYWGWRSALFVPGIFCIVMGFFLMNRLRDTPQSLGLPPIEKFKNDYPSAQWKEEEKELSLKELFFQYVLKNKLIWVLGVAYFFVYILRTAIGDWGVLFLVEEKGYTQLKAGTTVGCFEVGGILGSLVAGWASDLVFGGRRGPVNVIFSLAAALVLCFIWFISGNFLVDSVLFFLMGFFVFGPQMLIGMAAAELSHKKAAGTATGFVGWIAYLGAATAGYPLGILTQKMGWEGFFGALVLCGAISALVLSPLWRIKARSSVPIVEGQSDST
jgi:OPA family sugar phosphate sensor protein UhpC-like MFS transporter